MLWQIIKKQGLTLLRNRQQLLLLLGLPIILISILSAALGGFMSGKAMTIDVKVAMIEHEDEQEQIDQFITEVTESDLPEEITQSIVAGSRQFSPVTIFKEEVLQELSDIVQVETMTYEEKDTILNDDSYAALIEVPENFTYDALHHVFLDEETMGSLGLYLNEEKQLGSHIVEEVIDQFHEQISFVTLASKEGMNPENIVIDPGEITGNITNAKELKPTTSQDYYTVAMVVMNVLFIASTIGSYAYQEKKTNVFNRIIVSNVSRWIYFIGIFISTVIFAFIQSVIVFGIAWIMFGVVWENIFGFLLVTIGFSFAVGGLGVLLTAISYRLDSEVIINFFSSIIVSVFAFLGGSFFPVGDFSKVIRTIGNLTANGASMSAYLSVLRGSDLSVITDYMIFLFVFATVLLILAAISFPKRGEMA